MDTIVHEISSLYAAKRQFKPHDFTRVELGICFFLLANFIDSGFANVAERIEQLQSFHRQFKSHLQLVQKYED